MAWANLDIEPGLPNHPKIIQLESEVGEAALSYVLRLWCWAALDAPDGELTNYGNVNYLERRIMRWEGEPGALISALGRAELLRVEGEKVTIHNFKERNAHLTKFKERQRNAANARWEKWRASRRRNGQESI